LRQLGKTVRGIQKSTGYYSSNERTSFFYDGNEQVQDTWRHELTHQLFRESGRTNDNTLAEQFIWIDEGVATYFESLADFGDYVTLGGFDARRIQYSRIRRLLENFHIPINELSAFGRKDLQQHSDIERVYSEAAGLTDMLMNDQQGAYEKPLTEFLWLIHKGKVKPGTFQKIIGQTYQQLDDRYQEHLAVDSDTVARFLSKPESRTELSLPGANLQTAAFKQIAKCTNLTFLDLSKNAITTDQFVLLKDCQKINRLLLTSCSFEDGPIRGFELFPLLNDLDLSGSSIQDSQLSTFKYLPNLASLRLAVTGITDEGLAHLADVPGLTSLDLTRTKVTDQGIAKLRQRLPNLKVVR
jgi:Leucine-rich repeat (LRR) protein